jgi:hypothetical protein
VRFGCHSGAFTGFGKKVLFIVGEYCSWGLCGRCVVQWESRVIRVVTRNWGVNWG